MRRLLDRLLRRLVRWLRRRRYARTQARIRALELELGMREPTQLESGLKAMADALSTTGISITQRASDHARNYFANGDMTISDQTPQEPSCALTTETATSETTYFESVLRNRGALEDMFSPEAVESGRTKDFLQAYARNYARKISQ